MRRLLAFLILLALALLGAWLWRVVSADPGYVQIAAHGYSIETTLVVAIPAVLLALALLLALIRLLRLPTRFWSRRRSRTARERLAGGLVALHEGRWQKAERLLSRAASDSRHRLPALLAAARAAQSRGDTDAASEYLTRAAVDGDPIIAALLAARQHQRRGESGAITALFDAQPVAALPPRALEIYLDALADTGRAREALTLLPSLRASKVLEGEALAERETSLIAAALRQAEDATALDEVWQGLSRARKSDSRVVCAYARRAMACERSEAAVAAVEHAMRRHWSAELAAVYGLLPRGGGRSPLKMAEGWLAEHPNDPALLVTLGRLCRAEQIWGKAEDYLQRALALDHGAAAWEELGHVYAAQHRDAEAASAYAKALAETHGRNTAAPSQHSLRERIVTEAVAETRSDMGVPLLPFEDDVDDEDPIGPRPTPAP